LSTASFPRTPRRGCDHSTSQRRTPTPRERQDN